MSLPFTFKIKHSPEMVSTNTHAREQAEQGAEEGWVYVTDFQTSGRGQFDRKWESSRGKNLLFSILLRPPVSPAQAPLLTQLTAESIVKVLEGAYGVKSAIKKPNDILVDGKKICGILVESSSRSTQKVEYVVIGVGLNVNEAPGEVTPPPTAMKTVLGRDQDIPLGKLLDHLLGQFEKDLVKLYAHSV